MLYLTIDRGNTSTKCAVWEGRELRQYIRVDEDELQVLVAFINQWQPQKGILSSVIEEDEIFTGRFQSETGLPLMVLDWKTPLPIEFAYPRTTLGSDRAAAAVGAWLKNGRKPVLVVDCGTAMTIDLINSEGFFLGGNITAGKTLRFKSLHEATSLLPLVTDDGEISLFGNDTNSAIRDGVIMGMVYEIEGSLKSASGIVEDPIVYMTGGDAGILLPLLQKRGIQAENCPWLVDYGLLEILLFNIDEI